MLFLWIIVFLASIAVLIKSADVFTSTSEKIGLALRIAPFIVGVTIVSVGTSLPELVTSIIAVYKGATEFVTATAVGSNISNIFLIIGLSSVFAGVLAVRRNLIELDLPLVMLSTVLFVLVAFDQKITQLEAFVLLLGALVYFGYTISQHREAEREFEKELGFAEKHRKPEERLLPKREKLQPKLFGILVLSALGIWLGADFTVRSVTSIADILDIHFALITITVVAVGTSLPELVVSVRAALRKRMEIALGNIFGSNIFNVLVVVGIPGIFRELSLDDQTFTVGLPFLVIATSLLLISGIARRFHKWEGLMFLLLYGVFLSWLFTSS